MDKYDLIEAALLYGKVLRREIEPTPEIMKKINAATAALEYVQEQEEKHERQSHQSPAKGRYQNQAT